MRISKSASFANLKYPTHQEVITLKQSSPLPRGQETQQEKSKHTPSVTFATGVGR